MRIRINSASVHLADFSCWLCKSAVLVWVLVFVSKTVLKKSLTYMLVTFVTDPTPHPRQQQLQGRKLRLGLWHQRDFSPWQGRRHGRVATWWWWQQVAEGHMAQTSKHRVQAESRSACEFQWPISRDPSCQPCPASYSLQNSAISQVSGMRGMRKWCCWGCYDSGRPAGKEEKKSEGKGGTWQAEEHVLKDLYLTFLCTGRSLVLQTRSSSNHMYIQFSHVVHIETDNMTTPCRVKGNVLLYI